MVKNRTERQSDSDYDYVLNVTTIFKRDYKTGPRKRLEVKISKTTRIGFLHQ